MQEFVAVPCTTDGYELGESCRYDEVRGELYWVDILSGRFFRAQVSGANVEIIRSYEFDGFLSAISPMKKRSAGWVAALNQSIVVINEAGEVTELDRPEASRENDVRMNDGVADPWGRFWIGSMAFDIAEGEGRLFRYGATGTETILDHVTISNGLGWSPDRSTMYYVDSGPATIHAFDLDESGDIIKGRLFAAFGADEGAPDGLCVDEDGALWVAMWGGYQVRRYAPSGECLATVTLPTAQPSSCALGGTAGTTLYITTAKEDMSAETREKEADAGRLFCVDVGVKGQPIDSFSSLEA